MEFSIRSQSTVQSSNRISGSRKWWALATVLLTMFFSSMDQTVVSTAMPTIVSDLRGFSLYAWLSTSYMMASAVTVPIYGKLSDVFGRKPFYLLGLVLFGIGSAISGQAHTMMELVIARGFQGIGAGAMMSMPRATIGDIFDPKERGRWMGVMGAVFGVSSIIGPTIGGWITDSFSWRWVFYINLPFAVLAIIGVLLTLPSVRAEHRVKVDWVGSLLLVAGLVPILLAFTWAGSKYTWSSPVEIVLFATGVVILGLFVFVEGRVSDPIIMPSLFKHRIFTMSLVLGTLMAMTMFGSLMFLPLFVQGVIGLNAQQSGWVMSPMMFSFIVSSIISGQIMTRTGRYRVLANVSGAVTVLGLLLFMTMNVHTGYAQVVLNMVVLGLGIGALMPLLNVAVQNAFPYSMMGTVNASQQFVQSLGGVIVAPIFGSMLTQGFQHTLTSALPKTLQKIPGLASISPQSLMTAEAQKAIAGQFSKLGATGHTLYMELLSAVKLALTSGMVRLFEVGFGFAILLFIGTFFLPEVQLKGKEYFGESGMHPAGPSED